MQIPDKGKPYCFQIPNAILINLYKLYHKIQLTSELQFNNMPAIDLFSNIDQFNMFHEYKIIEEWIPGNIKEFRMERMYPVPEMSNAYLWGSRIPDVEFDKSEYKQLLSGGWPSLFWHADTYQPEDRIKMIIYLNDVNESNGAVCMEEDLTYINDESYSEIKNKYSCVSDIPGKFYNGTPGTAVIFRARQLHRINFPSDNHRDAIHIGFDSE